MMSSDRPIVILACRVFQHWLEQLLPDASHPEVTFFDYGLHAVPKNLRQTLQKAIDSIELPSLIVLGYGLCGNGLDQIEAGKHYLLIPRTDDCIALLLGSYQAYRREMEREPGTYYLSKGWLEAGTNPLAESQKYEEKYGAETAAYLMDTQYHQYRRLALVARNEQELGAYRSQAQTVAAYCSRWGMRYEELPGSDRYLQRLLEIAVGHEQPGEDFLLIPPGGRLAQSQFIR
ncbi:MAG TPA: DUF1638 domain-containing protein [Anaerolineales bacterium]|nr:DUF1638 domain-containing protein [Anaerolineales bacterium]